MKNVDDSSLRFIYLDNLKAWMIALVIVFHACLSYLNLNIKGWVQNSVTNDAVFGWRVL